MLEWVIYGHAEPAGSKRALPTGGKAGGRPIVVDANKKATPWKDKVAQCIGEWMEKQDEPLIHGAVQFELTFFVARPKGHFGKKGLLKSAPQFPTVKPDLLKLARAIEDALTKIVYAGDQQIVTEILKKRFDTPERVVIRVIPL